MQLNQIQAMKESTPGIKNDLGMKITLAEMFVRKKKEEKKKLAYDISQLLNRQCTLI